MNTSPGQAVVLAVGEDGIDAALTFAVGEARRMSRPLHLVHVLQVPVGDTFSDPYGAVLEEAKATISRAVASAGAMAGDDVPVTSELIGKGWVVDDLALRTQGASLLVLQHRAHSRAMRMLAGGSYVHSVAGRAGVPVVSVPEGWVPASGPVDRVVTAAVQNPVEAGPLLRTAFEEARAREEDLVVLHAWWLASGYDVVVVDDVMRKEWAERSTKELQPVLEPLRDEFPDVKVTVSVRHAPPVEAVLDAAEVSDLLVIGRRHHLLPLGSHLGPVARGVLDRAACPVLVMPEVTVPERPTDSAAAFDPLDPLPAHHRTTSQPEAAAAP